MLNTSEIVNLVAKTTNNNGGNPSLFDVNNKYLTYDELSRFIVATVEQIQKLNLSHADRIAVVLPNGPIMATAFLSIAASAACAPLNPYFHEEEYEYYFEDLKATVLVVMDGDDTPAIRAAIKLKIPIIKLVPKPENGVGMFELACDKSPVIKNRSSDLSGGIALILHTSGTTSRPKMVPLSDRNLVSSAANIAKILQLHSEDRCLNVMPLFHIHGLVASILASLYAGSSVICTPGFSAPEHMDWLDRLEPTWFSAVPTMHQAILTRINETNLIPPHTKLRFIRSSSSALPPHVMQELEHHFQVPVIEAYGMTEAAHQMASNPLPPHKRKPGSVGIPAGPEIAILTSESAITSGSQRNGEIVIRGDNVITGYLDNPEANAKSFIEGWFRTGDEGYFDDDHYLTITGRIKEIINRGGEKISPREIDEILLTHPGVSQALTFSIPSSRLGEEIGAAVVLKDESLTEFDLRRFVSEKLVEHKIPTRIIFLPELPKGPTGKLQRIGMAERLGLFNKPEIKSVQSEENIEPFDAVEGILMDFWCELLKLDRVSTKQSFLDYGGDSMLMMRLINRVRERFAIELTPMDFFDAFTIKEQAAVIKVRQFHD